MAPILMKSTELIGIEIFLKREGNQTFPKEEEAFPEKEGTFPKREIVFPKSVEKENKRI